MAKLDRKDVKIFAENSKETLVTEFRTEDAQGTTASFSRDPDAIQNENYSQGWVNDSNNLNTKIYGEDLNAVNYVLSYLLKYLYENGIAEWKSTTTYYQNSICKVDNALYLSLQDNNTGNDPTSTVSYWKLIPLENVSIENAGSGFSLVKDVSDNVITFKTISVTGYGEITDDGDQLNIDISGGGGGEGGDTYWGTIKGTITNQTDLMALINLKQDIFTVDSPLVLTDEQHLTINKATSSVSGYLDYNDFNTFNGKQDAISASLPISIVNNNIEIDTADESTTGVLSYTDWTTFNNKQDELAKATSTSDGYLSKEDWATFNGKQNVLPKATSTSNGYLSKEDWATFNGKQGAISVSSPLSKTNNTISISKASASQSGYIDATDWAKFNNKVSANNSTIKINMNGASKGSFTTNASSGVTIDLGTVVTSKSDCAKLAEQNTFTQPNFFLENIYLQKTSQTNVVLQNNGARPRFAYTLDGTGYATVATKTAWTFSSDRRLKKNIKTIENSLNIVKLLNPVKFDFNNDPRDDSYESGFIAQEIKEVIPQAVTEDENGYLSLGMNSIIPYLAGAIKELNAKIEYLEARVNELESCKKELDK